MALVAVVEAPSEAGEVVLRVLGVDVVPAIEGDLGGPQHLTEAERQIVRRAAVLATIVESGEATWLSGGTIDLQTHNGSVNTLRRLFETIGLQRRARDVTPPDPLDYAREVAGS